MTKNSTNLDAAAWRRVQQLLLHAASTRDAHQLIQQLAADWRALSGIDATYVSMLIPRHDQSEQSVVGAVCTGRRSNHLVEFTHPTASAWRARDVAAGLRRHSKVDVSSWKQIAQFPFRHDGPIIAGVLLFGKPDAKLSNRPLLKQVATLCAASFHQFASIEASTAVEKGSDWLWDAKLEALAEFAAGAGHEINNPVATIAGRASLLLRGETDPERRDALTTIVAQAYRIRDMIGDTMLFGRPPTPQPESLNLSDVVESTLAKLEETLAAKNFTVETKLGESVPIWADSAQLAIVISSLIHNSVNAATEDCTLRIETECIMVGDSPHARLTVADRGTGFTPTEREHLFDPFFSGRQAGRGLGFGLSKCWRIVTNHQGTIDVDTDSEEETVFRIIWPSRPAAKTEQA